MLTKLLTQPMLIMQQMLMRLLMQQVLTKLLMQ
jgi:hypothetical protein